MSDAGAIGVTIHDLAEILSQRYYNTREDKVKSHIGFGLILLKDLVELIEKKEIDLYLEDLPGIEFYKNEDSELEFIKNYLDGD